MGFLGGYLGGFEGSYFGSISARARGHVAVEQPTDVTNQSHHVAKTQPTDITNPSGHTIHAVLSVALSESADPVHINDAFSYTVSINNAGPNSALLVVQETQLDSSLTFVSASGSGWTIIDEGGGLIRSTRSTLDAGALAPITINVLAGAAALVATTIASVLACNSPVATPDSETTTVISPAVDGSHIVIAGQSNAEGLGGHLSTSDRGLDFATPFSAVQLYSQTSDAPTDPIVWTTVPTRDLQSYDADHLGTELAYGRYSYGTHGSTLAPRIGKVAVAGTGIATFLPGANFPTNPKELWLQMIDVLDARVVEFGRPIEAFVWIQGEQDSVAQPAADAYQTNLETLNTALRARYGNSFLFVVVRLNTAATGGGINATPKATVRAAQAAFVAAHPTSAVLINTDDVPLSADNLHYNADGFAVLGVRIAEAVANFFHPGRNTDRASGPTPWIQGNDQPIVTNNGSANLTPWLPLHKAGDVLVVCASNSGIAGAPTLAVANGFSQLGSSSVSTFGATVLTMAIFTKVAASSSESAPVIAPGAGNTRFAATAFTVRGASGTDGTQNAQNNTSGTALSAAGPVTTQPNDLVVFVVAGHTSTSNNSIGSHADAALASFGEVRDTIRAAGDRSHMLNLATGTKAAAGATGPMTATLAAAAIWCSTAIAFKP